MEIMKKRGKKEGRKRKKGENLTANFWKTSFLLSFFSSSSSSF